MNKITLFFQKSEFSQFYISPFVVESVNYSCCEQFMMHRKALLFGDAATAGKIMAAKRPCDMKRLGREVCGFSEDIWKDKRRDIVKTGNKAKFTQNEKLREVLMKTGGTILAEANPRDKIWGIGLSISDPNALDQSKWKGLNLLGNILMEIRDEIRNDLK